MTTLTTILQDVLNDLGQITHKFAATGGTATTTVNSDFVNEIDPPGEETFLRQYLFVHRDAGGASASPEGKFVRISAYNDTTWTLTHATLTDAPAAGDEIWVANQRNFPIFSVIASVNRALDVLGPYYWTDATSLTAASNQTEHNLPTSVLELLEVKVEGNDDSNDNQWSPVQGNWRVDGQPITMASEPQVYIPQQGDGDNLQLHYRGRHPALTAYNSPIMRFIPDELLIRASIVTLLKSYLNSLQSSVDKHWASMFSQAVNDFNEAVVKYPIRHVKKPRAHRLTWPAV